MEYIKVDWPDSQILMVLNESEMKKYDIELGEDCSFFVREDYYNEIMNLVKERT